MSQDFTHSQTFAAPPAQLYRAFTNSTFLREWLSDVATTAPRPGGYLFLAWNDGYYASGQFTSLAENEQVAFSWQGSNMPAPTQVNVRLNPAGEGTLLHLTHSALGEGDAWAGIAAQVQKGWQQSLENLASVLTTGEDLRFTRRPMLGIIIGEFNPETAARLGVPVSEGTRLDSVVEGMGAAAAGLQSDDVIVAVDGLPTTDFPSLTNALQAHRAGDTVEVAFYRGPDRLTTAMTLSGRPLPAIPATAGELASIAHHRYDAEEADLATLLADVSETEASTRPGPMAYQRRAGPPHPQRARLAHLDGRPDRRARAVVRRLRRQQRRPHHRHRRRLPHPGRPANRAAARPHRIRRPAG